MRPRFPAAVLWTSAEKSRSLSRRLWCLLSVFHLLDQFDGLMVPRSSRFDHHRIENVGIRQTAVLIGLVGSCMFCCGSCFPGWIDHMSIGKSVRYGDVPCQGFPLAHGRIVVPSGRFPSSRIKPTGSFTACIWARFKANLTCHKLKAWSVYLVLSKYLLIFWQKFSHYLWSILCLFSLKHFIKYLSSAI